MIFRLTPIRIATFALLGFFTAACQSGQSDKNDIVQWRLPDKLGEVSGLALTRDERLFAVADEAAIVYEIDYVNGGLIKAFAIGNPTVRGDFEGIAVLDGMVWLMTSKGRLYSFREGGDGERVAYERVNTGLGDECEFEGLAAESRTGKLLLVCKDSKKKKKGLRIFEWLAADDNDQKATEIDLDEDAMADSIDKKQVHPSGIAINPVTGNLVVIAARQHAVFELSRAGQLLDVILNLDANRHGQPEGVAVTQDGRLLIADEAGNGAARLAVYSPEQQEKMSE
jgi:uncharacterized protein YjiK